MPQLSQLSYILHMLTIIVLYISLKIHLTSPIQASCGTIFPSFIHVPLVLQKWPRDCLVRGSSSDEFFFECFFETWLLHPLRMHWFTFSSKNFHWIPTFWTTFIWYIIFPTWGRWLKRGSHNSIRLNRLCGPSQARIQALICNGKGIGYFYMVSGKSRMEIMHPTFLCLISQWFLVPSTLIFFWTSCRDWGG